MLENKDSEDLKLGLSGITLGLPQTQQENSDHFEHLESSEKNVENVPIVNDENVQSVDNDPSEEKKKGSLMNHNESSPSRNDQEQKQAHLETQTQTETETETETQARTDHVHVSQHESSPPPVHVMADSPPILAKPSLPQSEMGSENQKSQETEEEAIPVLTRQKSLLATQLKQTRIELEEKGSELFGPAGKQAARGLVLHPLMPILVRATSQDSNYSQSQSQSQGDHGDSGDMGPPPGLNRQSSLSLLQDLKIAAFRSNPTQDSVIDPALKTEDEDVLEIKVDS